MKKIEFHHPDQWAEGWLPMVFFIGLTMGFDIRAYFWPVEKYIPVVYLEPATWEGYTVQFSIRKPADPERVVCFKKTSDASGDTCAARRLSNKWTGK